MKLHKTISIALLLLLAVAGSARAADYFDDFGGKAGIDQLVDKFVDHVLEDKRISDYFANTKIPHLKMELSTQFCQLLGGPCKYTGMDMQKAHSDLGVTNAAFNSLAEDLQWAMDQQNIPLPAQNALLKQLAPMQRQVVTQ